MASTERDGRPGHAAEPADRPRADPAAADGAAGTTTYGFDQTFDEESLYALRSAVAAHGTDLGLTEARVADLVLVAHELAANAVRHGGATSATPGRITLWREDHALLCRVSDGGPGIVDPERAGLVDVPLAASNGRGLWIIRQVVDRLDIDSGGSGTTITAEIHLDQGPDPA